MKIVYVATGDYPSKFAHKVQIMKNAQSWSKVSDSFEFTTNMTFRCWLKRGSVNLFDYYALRERFRVVAFPFFIFEQYKIPFLKDLYYKLVATRCKKRKVDLIFTRTFPMAKYALKNDIKVLVESHGPPDASKEKMALYNKMSDPNFCGLVTISDELKRRYVEFGLPENKIIVAKDGVDLDRFEKPLSKAEACDELGLSKDKFIAMYVGHLYEDRGISDILNAACNLQDVNFVIVGGHDEDVARWKRRIEKRQIKNVSLVGFVKNGLVHKYLYAGDVLLMPYSKSCPTAEWMSPLKMFEYMAAGRPIIASDLPALSNVLVDNENCLLVEPDNGVEIEAAIRKVMNDPVFAEKISEAARVHASKFSWDDRVVSILKIARKSFI